MKNKALKYILIIAVIGIWGLIFSKIFGILSGPKSEKVEEFNSNRKESAESIDTFSIRCNYPDPFLKSLILKSKILNVDAKVGEIMKKTVKPQILQSPWPKIVFAGLVSNTNGSRTTILITIGGENFLMKKGDLIKGVELITILRDSARFKFEDSQKYIKRYENK